MDRPGPSRREVVSGVLALCTVAGVPAAVAVRRRIAVRADARFPHLGPRAPRPPALLSGAGTGLPGPAGHAAHLPGDHFASSLGAARCRLDLRLSLRGEPPALALVAVPVWQGKPLYRSYLITGTGSGSGLLDDLRGDVHAFSDPDSNSGWLVTATALAGKGQTPGTVLRPHDLHLRAPQRRQGRGLRTRR